MINWKWSNGEPCKKSAIKNKTQNTNMNQNINQNINQNTNMNQNMNTNMNQNINQNITQTGVNQDLNFTRESKREDIDLKLSTALVFEGAVILTLTSAN